MNKKNFLLLLLSLSFSISLFPQQKETINTKLDSLLKLLPSIKIDTSKVNILNKIAEEYEAIDPKRGITYSNKALQIAKKENWNDGVTKSLLTIGHNYFKMGDLKKAEIFYEKALVISKNKLYTSKLYLLSGGLELNKTNYSKAVDYFFKALNIAEEIMNENLMASSYYALSRTYNELKDNKKAMLYSEKSLLLNTKLQLKNSICKNYIVMGEIYRDDRKTYDIALEYLFKALKIGEEINDKSSITHVNSVISTIYQFQDKYELALKHILVGKKIAEEINYHRLIAGYKLDEGLIYLLQFEQDSLNPKRQYLLAKAEILIFDALKLYRERNDKYNISVCYDTITYLYQLQNKDKEATLMALKYAGIKDSIFSEQSSATIKNLEAQRTIDLKDKEIEINKITLESKEKQKWFYITGIGFLAIIGGLFFYQSSKRRKTNQKLQFLNSELDQANKAKVKFLSILNHDLRSPVYNFIHFMQLQKESPELLDASTKKTIETKTINSAENLLASMEDLLLWSKGQMDNFKPHPKDIAVNSLFEDTKKHFESEEKVIIEFENPDAISIHTDENFLKTIIRNLTGNAIKATKNSKKAKITWRAWQNNDKTYLSITDSGSGMNQEKFKALYDENEVVGIKSGLGLHLIRDLAKAINCKVSIDNDTNEGTTFNLEFI